MKRQTLPEAAQAFQDAWFDFLLVAFGPLAERIQSWLDRRKWRQ